MGRGPTARLTAALGLVLGLSGAALLPIVARAWRVCFEATAFRGRECGALQSDFDYTLVLSVWGVALLLVLTGLVVARSRRSPFAWALLPLLLGNGMTDYAAAPLLNGGYSSWDFPPGMGYWAAGCLLATGAVLIVGALWPGMRRTAESGRESVAV